MIQLTEHRKLKMKQDSSADVSYILNRGNKIIMGDRGKERKTGTGSDIGGDRGEVQILGKLNGGM